MAISKNFLQELEKSKIAYTQNVSLKELSSFKIGGRCDIYAAPQNLEQLKSCISLAVSANVPYFILGNGTNVLFKDDGFRGFIINITDAMSGLELIDKTTIKSAAGTPLYRLCKFAQQHSLGGLEFAYGIPGTVGGAIYMNAGAYLGEVEQVIQSAEFISGDEILSVEKSEMKLGYRTSIFEQNNCCVTSGTFSLFAKDKQEIKARMETLMARRREKQPIELPSAGSTFKRPNGDYAARLIELSGLKGTRIGGAMVSEKHSGFVVNCGSATFNDVIQLTEQIKKTVFELHGIMLELEVKVV